MKIRSFTESGVIMPKYGCKSTIYVGHNFLGSEYIFFRSFAQNTITINFKRVAKATSGFWSPHM
jgi:hypothetical protein